MPFDFTELTTAERVRMRGLYRLVLEGLSARGSLALGDRTRSIESIVLYHMDPRGEPAPKIATALAIIAGGIAPFEMSDELERLDLSALRDRMAVTATMAADTLNEMERQASLTLY